MARQQSKHPTDTELEIPQVLWDHGPCSLGSICEAMRENREVATTTVSTMLKVMDAKGLVRRKDAKGQRGSLWAAAVTRKKAARGMVGSLLIACLRAPLRNWWLTFLANASCLTTIAKRSKDCSKTRRHKHVAH